MFIDTILEDSDVVEVDDLLEIVRTNPKFFNNRFLGIRLASHSELGFEEYFYPRHGEAGFWIYKFNGQPRIAMRGSQSELMTCYNKNLGVIAEFIPEFGKIGSPND